ncbi:MAG: GAF domain-containing protein, partial [Anaerolineae bacterium]|nr:GAF domain-containing protein [Anaerolineae bacterium]
FIALLGIFSLILLVLVRYGKLSVASTIFVVLVTASALPTGSGPTNVFWFLATLALMASALLSNMPVFLLVNCAIFARYTMLIWPLVGDTERIHEFSTLLILGMTLFTVSSITRYIVDMLQKSNLTSRRNALLVQATNEVGQAATSLLDLDTLFDRSVEIIRSRFDFYHVQVFMVRENQAVLVASTGYAGRQLLEKQHKLAVGSPSVIGQVTQNAQPVIARKQDGVHQQNPLLPDTQSELAVPIMDGDRVVGALDMQSVQPHAFQPEDVQALQSMANLLAVAIRNAALFRETTRQLQENTLLAAQSQEALSRVEQLNRQLTGEAWSEFLGARSMQPGLDVDFDSGQAQTETAWTPEMEAAAHQNHLIEREVDGRRVLVAPIRVRGQVIGAMEFELDPGGQLSEEDQQLIGEVSERFGLAAENARLFAESQRIAQREALINEVGARLQATSSVETTLAQAARSLQQMLKAERVSIRLGEPPTANGSGKEGH